MVQGFIFEVKKSPKDLSLQQRPISTLVAAGLTVVISYPHQFQALCNAFQLINKDSVNPCTIIINGDFANPQLIAPSASFGIDSNWIEELIITAGAGGATQVFSQIVPIKGLVNGL